MHEVLGVENVMDSYENVAEDLLSVGVLSAVTEEKYQMPKYAVKIALGFPTHGGGLEKAFMEFLDRDGEVERF